MRARSKSAPARPPEAGSDGNCAGGRGPATHFDVGSRLLRRDDEVRHLSPKAQQLLWMLIEARPDAVSRQDLSDELWPSTFVAETNLPCIVNEVRRALDDDSRTPRFIRTVHAYGEARPRPTAAAT